jgi:uncharacterized NAD(P)/FAD-binding protein YdhS
LLTRGLDKAMPSRIQLMRDTVVRIHDADDRVRLCLATGEFRTVNLAVIATGNLPSEPLCPDANIMEEAGLWQGNPWDTAALATIERETAVMLVGTGLTAVDTIISLLDQGHTGPIHAVSRHGLLPRCHAAAHAAPVVLPLPGRMGAMTRCIRQGIARSLDAGGDWRPVIDALRPHTQALWRGMCVQDRARFRRHLCTWWDVHRHRMAPPVADRIAAAQASGQLTIHAARLTHFATANGSVAVGLRHRTEGKPADLYVSRVIAGTGPCADVTRAADTLLQDLLWTGLARPDSLGLGLDVTEQGALLRRDGVPSERLFAIGPPTKGAAWEITAVPDIRQDCRDLASRLAKLLADDIRHSEDFVPAGRQDLPQLA